jgi:hypothetical protein
VAERDAATAEKVCGLLVDWSNDLSASINATSKTITDADDPKTANGVLLDGYDDMIGLAHDHVDQAKALELPATGARAALLDDLTHGAEKSIDELQEGRDRAAALDPIDVDGQPGALGGALNVVEAAKSVVEPVVASYHDQRLTQAFADEPDCVHVIQPS